MSCLAELGQGSGERLRMRRGSRSQREGKRRRHFVRVILVSTFRFMCTRYSVCRAHSCCDRRCGWVDDENGLVVMCGNVFPGRFWGNESGAGVTVSMSKCERCRTAG